MTRKRTTESMKLQDTIRQILIVLTCSVITAMAAILWDVKVQVTQMQTDIQWIKKAIGSTEAHPTTYVVNK